MIEATLTAQPVARRPRRPRATSTKAKSEKTDAQQTWEREKRKAKAEHFENLFWQQLMGEYVADLFVRNKPFLDGFNYLADFASARHRLAVEIDGGVGIGQMNKQQQRRYLQEQALLLLAGKEPQLRPQGGHHNNPKGYRYDRIRDCEAILQGWITLRFPPDMVEDGTAIHYTLRVLRMIEEVTQLPESAPQPRPTTRRRRSQPAVKTVAKSTERSA